MLSGVKGRIVIVTGGASGMGAACARLLAGQGARVVIVDRDGVGAANVAAGIGATVVAGDVTDSAFCDGPSPRRSSGTAGSTRSSTPPARSSAPTRSAPTDDALASPVPASTLTARSS